MALGPVDVTGIPASIPEVSRAAVLRRFGTPLAVAILVPRALKPAALLVQTDCGMICGTDVRLIDGSLARKVDLPVIAGHERTGRVVAKGAGTDTGSTGRSLSVGQRTVREISQASGIGEANRHPLAHVSERGMQGGATARI